MKRAASLMVVMCAFGQSPRDAYRETYRQWREADPTLERDAATAPATDLTARSAKAATGAAQYASARAAFLQQLAADQAQKSAWLEAPPDAPSSLISETASALIAADSRSVRRTMETFATDPDPGIRQLRTVLTRESAALDALSAAMEKRKQAADAVKSANAAAADSQLKVAEQYQTLDADGKQSLEEADKDAAAWAQYYAALSKPPREAAPPPPAPVSTPTVTPLPLIRYTGAWTFPPLGMYHGPRPEILDLVVYEKDGHASGMLTARFQLPPGSTADPVLKFDFAGDFKNTRTQTFPLTTAEGAHGTIELIPGPAFNLLEINFQTDAKPGKIRQANVVLLKK